MAHGFGMTRRQSLIILGFGGLAWSARPLLAAQDWFDMGPIDGSADGHVWSRVIDEVGNTQARFEEWHMALPAEADVDIALQAPDPGKLDVRIRYTGQYGDPIEHLLSAEENAAPGGYRHVYGPWSPEGVRDIRILVATRDSSTDQVYQLTVTLTPRAGETPAETGTPAALLGTWSRSENGTKVESMDIVASGDAVTLIFRDAAGGETGRATGKMANGRLTASTARRLVTITLEGNQLSYTSSDHDGGNPWTGYFQR